MISDRNASRPDKEGSYMEEKILQTKKNGMTMLLLTLLGYVAAIIVFVLGGILLTAEHNAPGVI